LYPSVPAVAVVRIVWLEYLSRREPASSYSERALIKAKARTLCAPDRFCRNGAAILRRYRDSCNSVGSGQGAFQCLDKWRHNRTRYCDFEVPLVLANCKKKRCKRRTVYHKSCGRQYRDRRKRVIETRPAGTMMLVDNLAKSAIAFLADFEGRKES